LIDPRRLTEAALGVCRELHITPDDLYDKTPEEFAANHMNTSTMSMTGGFSPGKGAGAAPKEIIELRYNHYQNKRRSKTWYCIIESIREL